MTKLRIPYEDTWTEVTDHETRPGAPRKFRVRVRCADCGAPVVDYPPFYVTCPNRTAPGWGACGKSSQ